MTRSAGVHPNCSAGKGGRAKSNWPDTPTTFRSLAPRKRDEPSPFSPWLSRALLFLPGLATGFILGRLLGGSGGSGGSGGGGKGAGGKKGELTAGGRGSSSGRKGGGGSAGGRSAPVFGGKAETEGAGGLVVGRGSELKMVLVVRQDLKMSAGKIAAQCAREWGRGGWCKQVSAVSPIPTSSPPPSPPTLPTVPFPLPDAAVGILTGLQTRGNAAVGILTDLQTRNELRGKAQQHRLPVFTVCDAGRTQVAAGSKTVLAVGPGPCSLTSFHLSLPATHTLVLL
ncbi:unnamed protein product [Closterium sp. Naga37s-1]|nr:unnamed protein product [Closterium sp. Naga37s-1]